MRFLIRNQLSSDYTEPEGPYFGMTLDLLFKSIQIENGYPANNNNFYDLFIVVNNAANTQGNIYTRNQDGGEELITCITGGTSVDGSTPGCVYRLKPQEYLGWDTGNFLLSSRVNFSFINIAIYDYRALKVLGMMYEELLACAVSRKYQVIY